MKKGISQGLERGLGKGRAEGRAEGREEGQALLVQQLLHRCEECEVVEMTGLDIDAVRRLRSTSIH